jgi:hypothetical protein
MTPRLWFLLSGVGDLVTDRMRRKLLQNVGDGGQELLTIVWLREKDIRLDKEGEHSVRDAPPRRVDDRKPRTGFRGGFRQF